MGNRKKTFDDFLREHPMTDCPEMAGLKQELADAFGIDVVCLPCDDPILGEVGCVIFQIKDGKEKSVIIRRTFGPKADSVKMPSKKDIEQEYYKALMEDHVITRYDDPVNRLVGFIVSRGSGRKWYHISFKDLRADEQG